MRAILFEDIGKLRVGDYPEPTLLEPGDAVMKVTTAAICGSDLHLLHGRVPGLRADSPIGHEFVGTVTEVGSGVTRFEPGARVVGSFLIACGECRACAKRRFNFCLERRALGLGPFNGDLEGAQADYVLVPNADINLHVLSGPHEALTNEQALFAGDILTTGAYAARVADVAPGDVVAVIGAGPVGLFCALASKAAGADRVLILDVESDRIAFARDVMGLEALDVSEMDPQAAVNGATEGALADVAMDAVGALPAFKSTVKVVRDGGRVVVVGVYASERYELSMGMAWLRGLDIRFTGMANVQGHWDEVLNSVADGRIDPTPAITHRLSLDEAEEGYELFRTKEATKVVLTPGGVQGIVRPPYRVGFDS